MNWLTIVWSICGGLCFMLGLLHILLWIKDRYNHSYLLSSIMAMSAGASAIIELALLHAQTTQAYAWLLKLEVSTIYILLMSMIRLVALQLGDYQRWLAYLIAILWTLSLIFNFLSPGSLVYEQVNVLNRGLTFWGEHYSVGSGPENPWNLLSNLGVILIIIYVVNASRHAWRNGKQRRAITLGGSMIFFMVVGGTDAMLVDSGIINKPYMISFAYLAIVMVMSYELVNQAIQVPVLSRTVALNQKRWEDLLDNVQLAVIALDNEGKMIYVNPFLQKLSGYREQDLLHESASELLPESEQTTFQDRFQQALQQGPRPQSHWRIRCASGEERHLDWSSVRLFDNEGQVIGLVSVGADVTDQLQAQHDLQNTQQEMERIVRANILGELASTMAHELNQPLTAILSNAQAARRMLNADKLSDDILGEILDDIVRDDKRASEVIHGVRALLHQGDVSREAVDVTDAIMEIMRIVKTELENQGIKMELAISPGLSKIQANKVEFQQVLMNLIVNAMRIQCDQRPSERYVHLAAGMKDGFIEITVRDRGPGIKQDDLVKIFEPFFTTRREGLGMGLALSRRIVEAHEGKIWAENHPEGGAMFTFTIPVAAR